MTDPADRCTPPHFGCTGVAGENALADLLAAVLDDLLSIRSYYFPERGEHAAD